MISRRDTARSLGRPGPAQVADYASRFHLTLSEEELADATTRLGEALEVFERLYTITEPDGADPDQAAKRDPGRVPDQAEDPLRAIVRFCEVPGAGRGPLAGKRIGVKDNIAVAGVPMAAPVSGATLTPREDAVVVERLLKAGATIAAKTRVNLWEEPEATLVRNPLDSRFAAGGSSAGSAAAVATGLVDAALGADQGGSIRIPAAWCGIVGMKATHGLVPSYGLSYWDHTLDHIGPMTRTVAENALLLRVIAGGDDRDPHWIRTDPVAGDYPAAVGLGVTGMRIGVVTDSLEPVDCTPATLDAFTAACKTLRQLGAQVRPVSVPLWTKAPTIWVAVLTLGLMAMEEWYGHGAGHGGRVDDDRAEVAGDCYRRGSREAPSPFGTGTLPLLAAYLREQRFGGYFARAHNLRLALRRQLEEVLGEVDLLVTPTTPSGPPRLGAPRARRRNQVSHPDSAHLANYCIANLSGHPALTLPSVAADNGMPAGLQIIGRNFEESTVYRAAFAFENADRG